MRHITVLLQETVDAIRPEEGQVYVDMTLNDGGHTEEIFRRTKGNAKVIGIDADASAIRRAKERLSSYEENFFPEVSNFRYIDKVLEKTGFPQVKGVIADLGLSSNQLEESGRGFSFKSDEPLLMTFSEKPGMKELTALEVINTWKQENLETVIRYYGEEKFAGRIARVIVEEREKGEIKTAKELADIVSKAVPFFYRKGRIHPATKTFQAIRIAVNDEMRALEEGLSKAFEALSSGGRLAVISFHSIEDRIVKNFMKGKEEGTVLTKKPIVPSEKEIKENPRSRSAKLRIIEKK